MNRKEKIYFLNFSRKWQLSDGSFYFTDSDFIFLDNNWNYYRHIDCDGYITYLKKKIT